MLSILDPPPEIPRRFDWEEWLFTLGRAFVMLYLDLWLAMAYRMGTSAFISALTWFTIIMGIWWSQKGPLDIVPVVLGPTQEIE